MAWKSIQRGLAASVDNFYAVLFRLDCPVRGDESFVLGIAYKVWRVITKKVTTPTMAVHIKSQQNDACRPQVEREVNRLIT